ncbi:MAG: DUF3667 domain-containing protein [Gammaproteobacteria bacterium]|nr:DUF3667 domain-containing protein [Gammaproteobacteria bacterium]MDH3766954.1 DUF3667 domain-containing protein [Gammaproteobacteria bacterium]
MEEPVCQNCRTTLNGQYCAQCGQRDKNQIISLWELLRDLVGDLFEVDSRVWRTLAPLLFKPGRLTIEYLRGRRVHYTPPLRLYLVTSLIFFLFVFIDSDSSVKLDDFVINGDTVDASVSLGGSGSEDTPTQDDSPVPGDTAAVAEAPVDEAADESLEDRCQDISVDTELFDADLQAMVQRACLNLTAPGGATRFLRELIDNVPTMMFFFLPAIALVMIILYPLSRRYYVEHLLFFVHFHSFFFLIMTLTVLFSRIPSVLPGQGVIGGLLTAAVTIYIPIYLFVAMRRVYQQSRSLTAVKYVALGIAYSTGLLFLFTAMALFTALTV